MTSMTVLKKLKTIYWRALGNNKWHIALQALELQVKCVSIPEQQCSSMIGEVTKLDAALKHPPPMHT